MGGRIINKQMKQAFVICAFFIGVFSLLFLLNACNKNTTCLTPKIVNLRSGFYVKNNENIIKDTLLNNSNIIFGKQNQFFINFKSTNKFALPLAQNKDTVTLLFQPDSSNFDIQTIDSIHIYYERNLHYISVACGYETYFTLKKIETTHIQIDTVLIQKVLVDNDVNIEHLKIILKNN